MVTLTNAQTSRGRAVLTFEVQEALSVSRNLGVLSRRLPGIQLTAIKTLQRRLPVEARRDIQAEYDVPAARIRKDLAARNTAAGLKLVGYFRGIGLRNFRARDLRKSGGGVSYAIFSGRRESLPSAFFAGLNSGNAQVVQRSGPKRVMTAGRYKGKKREPLVAEYGPSVAQMLRKGRRPERLADYSRGVVRAEIERLIDYYLGGRSPSATATGATP